MSHYLEDDPERRVNEVEAIGEKGLAIMYSPDLSKVYTNLLETMDEHAEIDRLALSEKLREIEAYNGSFYVGYGLTNVLKNVVRNRELFLLLHPVGGLSDENGAISTFLVAASQDRSLQHCFDQEGSQVVIGFEAEFIRLSLARFLPSSDSDSQFLWDRKGPLKGMFGLRMTTREIVGFVGFASEIFSAVARIDLEDFG